MSADAAAARGAATIPADRGWRWLFVVLVLLTLLVRLAALDVDPTRTMPEASLMDEGIWADGARGDLLFHDYFADDTGDAYLMAPLHTFVLRGVFQLFGIGLWQVRLPSALASVLLATVLGLWVARRRGARAGCLVVTVLALCPLFDQHARVNLLESSQVAWTCLAFCLLFARRPRGWRALLAGVAMAAAFATKPNAVQFGALPLAAAFLIDWRAAALAGEPGCHRQRLRTALLATAGGLLGFALLVLPVWWSHWPSVVETANAESGNANWTLADHLLHLGSIGTRNTDGMHFVWALLRHAIALSFGAWIFCLAKALGRSGPCSRDERLLLTWLLVILVVAELSYQHVGRRQLHLLAPMAALLAYPGLGHARSTAAAVARPNLAWFLLLLPVWLLLKPRACRLLAASTWLADNHRTAGEVAGLLLFLPFFLSLLLPWRRHAAAIAAPLLRAAPAVFVLLLLAELPRLGCLPPYQRTITAAQQAMAELVRADQRAQPPEVVLGQSASLLFMKAPVRAVRRNQPGLHWSSGRPNPEVFTKLHPRYLLDYQDPEQREMADLSARGYHVIASTGYLREADDTLRYALELFERDKP